MNLSKNNRNNHTIKSKKLTDVKMSAYIVKPLKSEYQWWPT